MHLLFWKIFLPLLTVISLQLNLHSGKDTDVFLLLKVVPKKGSCLCHFGLIQNKHITSRDKAQSISSMVLCNKPLPVNRDTFYILKYAQCIVFERYIYGINF